MARSISPFERYGEYRPQTDANLRVHFLMFGETITGLSYRYYGDWRLWRLIADRNEIADPRKLEVGARLLIPQKPREKGRYASV